MKLNNLSNDVNKWFDGSGPHSDIIISSRIRLARNIAGYKFLSRCSLDEKEEILTRLKDILMDIDLGDKVFYISVEDTPALERNLLVERHLISRNHAFGKGPRGAIIAEKEFFTAMINEEDHLRIQILKSGSQISQCYEQIDRIDDEIEKKIPYSFSTKYGYLTACPTNLGTGIRVSVMMHLPAIKMTNQLERLFNAVKDLGLTVRGLFGEGSEASGDFYQLSNQITLGVSEKEIIENFEKEVIPEIINYETTARKYLLDNKMSLLNDKIARAMALLKNAHLISSQEALLLLSHLRLGLNMHLEMGASSPAIDSLFELSKQNEKTPQITIRDINRLFMLTLPAHLQLNHGKTLDPNNRDALRAQIIKHALNPKSLS